MKTFRICIALSFLVTGCATMRAHRYEAKLKSFEGHDFDEVANEFGPPTSSFAMKNGNTIYQYTSGGGSTGAMMHGIYVSNDKYCTTTFTVDTFHRISQWKYEGNNCGAGL